ncbi:MAG: hypothetical protein JSR27_12010 [Proteobacteria bacterium]|nr:hypothetical protein [Pseudomonadota bacterium]
MTVKKMTEKAGRISFARHSGRDCRNPEHKEVIAESLPSMAPGFPSADCRRYPTLPE